MSSRVIRLILLIGLVAIISYIFILNPHQATVTYGYGRTWAAPMALVLIVVFFLGVLVSALLSFFVGAQLSFSHWRERKLHKLQREHMAQLVTVREYLAAKRYDVARPALQRMIEQDPDNIVARVMLAEAWYALGDKRAALNVLDEARAGQKRNMELLFLAAEIHQELGNYTAAFDNLALVLQQEPNNRAALELIIFAAEQLKRFDRAVEYQAQLIKISSPEQYTKAQERLADFELQQLMSSPDGQAQKLEELLRRHRNFAPAISELAKRDQQTSQFENAAKRLTQAYRESRDVRYLEALTRLWLDIDEPSRAVAMIKAAIGGELTTETLSGEMFYVLLLLSLGMNEEASSEFRRVRRELDQLAAGVSALQLKLLEAKLLEREGKAEESLQLVRQVAEGQVQLPGHDLLKTVTKPASFSKRAPVREQPSPRLSTP